MKKPQSDREQSAALMWDWIWPFILLGNPIFGAVFIILPDPNWTKFLIAATLILAQLILAYRMRYQRQLARLFFFFGVMWFLNMAFFAAGFGMLTCLRFRWPQDAGYGLLVLGSLAGVAYLTWRYYTPVMKELHERDTHTGRFDLEQGTYSLAIPPTFYEYKTPLLRKAMGILLPYSGVLIAISAASGVRGGSKLLHGRDVGSGVLFLVMATIFVGVATCGLYTYRWIRRWEKATGRTMWIKGFEPGSKAS